MTGEESSKYKILYLLLQKKFSYFLFEAKNKRVNQVSSWNWGFERGFQFEHIKTHTENLSVCQESPGNLIKIEIFIRVSGMGPGILYFWRAADSKASPHKQNWPI